MRILKALVALVLVVAVGVGLPWFLVTAIGNPWPPEGVSLTSPLTGRAVEGILAVLAWILWAQLVAAFVAETFAFFRNRGDALALPGVLGTQQQWARAAVWAIAAGVIGSTVSTAATVSSADAATSPIASSTSFSQQVMPAVETAPTDVADQADEAEPQVISVPRGGSLWSLAETHLGDGTRWKEIRDLNMGRPMVGGQTFTGDVIEPGWELRLPADATNVDQDHGEVDHIVKPGETLSGIAERELGDGSKYREVLERSQKIDQPIPLTDPDKIYPGQRLDVHPGAADPAPAPATPRHSAPEPPAPRERAADPQTPEQRHDERPNLVPETAPRAEDADPAPAPTSAPERDNAGTSASPEVENDSGMPGWVVPGLASGGGAVLAGAAAIMLHQRRAARRRQRRPGFVMSTPSPETVQMEASVVVAGAKTAHVIEIVDDALRRLAEACTSTGQDLPTLAAVEVTDSWIGAHTRTPAVPPTGTSWTATEDGLLLLARRDRPSDSLGPTSDDAASPWPLVVTVGCDDAGSTWLLNLEGLSIDVRGDETASADFARFIGAELACNPWSSSTKVDVVGVGDELTAIDPTRIRSHEAATYPAQEGVVDSVRSVDRLNDYDVDVATARAQREDPDEWTSRALIVGHGLADTEEVAQLHDLLQAHGSNTGASLVVSAETVRDDAFVLQIDENRRLSIPAVGLEVDGVGLTADEAYTCAALLEHAQTASDEPAADLDGDEPWKQLVKTTGALRDQYRVDRSTPSIEPAASVLPDEDETYVDVAATTSTDLNELAPKVTSSVEAKVRDADPTLDDDLAAWHSDQNRRPKLSLLGPVEATTHGTPLADTKAWHTELFAFIVTRPHGATRVEVATAMNIQEEDVRKRVNELRNWLGRDPQTLEAYIPDAKRSPSAKRRGVNTYEVPQALNDLDLLRRLRVRGESSGPEGIRDLRAALNLVQGVPFTHLREGGWNWLITGNDRLDQVATTTVCDIAHLVVIHELQAGNIAAARAAVDLEMLVGANEDMARLDMAQVLQAEGRTNEAAAYVRDQVANRSDNGSAPIDLPARTEAIIEARDWLDQSAI